MRAIHKKSTYQQQIFYNLLELFFAHIKFYDYEAHKNDTLQGDEKQFNKSHVLFQTDGYIDNLFKSILQTND